MPISSLGLAKPPVLDPNVQAQQGTAGIDDALARLAMPPLQDPQMPDFQVDDPNQRVSFKDNPLGAIGLVLSNTAAGMRGDELPTDKLEQRQREDARLAKEDEFRMEQMKMQKLKFASTAVGEFSKQLEDALPENVPGLVKVYAGVMGQATGEDMMPLLQHLADSSVSERQNAQEALSMLSPEYAAILSKNPDLIPGVTKTLIGAQIEAAYRAPTANTYINMAPGEKAYDVARGKHQAASMNTILENGRKAALQIDGTREMMAALKDPNLYTGAGADAMLDIKKKAQSLGLDVEGVASGELARSLSNQMAMQMRNPTGGEGLTGSTSDADREFLVSSVNGIPKTPAGNALMAEGFILKKQRQVAIANMAADYEAEHGRLDNGFDQQVADYSAKHPIFNEGYRARVDAVIKQNKPRSVFAGFGKSAAAPANKPRGSGEPKRTPAEKAAMDAYSLK